MLRVKVPVLITIVAGVFMILKFFLDVPLVTLIADELEQWCLIIAAVAVILGVGNILRINLKVILRRGEDWPYKLVLVGSMLLMILVGIIDLIRRGDVEAGSMFRFMFDYVMVPLSATVFALLAFFIASAAFRAFRARNVRATLLLVAAALVMIGRVPLGAEISGYFPKVADWLMTVPNAAGQRGLIIGAALGVIATGLRIIFGIERPYLRGE
jgi:hypothetical protein